MVDINTLPVKIFSVVEGDAFLYEAVTNKIFRLEQAETFDDQELIARFIRESKISAQFLEPPKFSLTFDEYRRTLEKKTSRLILEVTRRCNMRCDYCVYSGKFQGRRSHENFDMSRDTLERAIKFYAAHSSNVRKGSISFYGGESLLRVDEIFHAINYAAQLMPEKNLSFAIATNGLLLNDKIFSRLANLPNVALNVTLNGSSHDKHRRTIDGKATREILLDKLNAAKKNFPQVWKNQIGLLCNYADFAELKAQRNFYLHAFGKMPLLINPIVPPNFCEFLNDDNEKISAREELADAYFREGDDFLAAYFRVPVAVIHDRPIFASPRSFFNSCIPFVNRIFVTADGRFQICTETIELDDLGNLDDGFNFSALKKIFDAAEKIFADSDCRRCWAQRLCPACLKDFLSGEGYLQQIDSAFCKRIRAALLCDLKLYCRLSCYRRDLLKRLIDC